MLITASTITTFNKSCYDDFISFIGGLDYDAWTKGN